MFDYAGIGVWGLSSRSATGCAFLLHADPNYFEAGLYLSPA
jgi:hypothetical protein